MFLFCAIPFKNNGTNSLINTHPLILPSQTPSNLRKQIKDLDFHEMLIMTMGADLATP